MKRIVVFLLAAILFILSCVQAFPEEGGLRRFLPEGYKNDIEDDDRPETPGLDTNSYGPGSPGVTEEYPGGPGSPGEASQPSYGPGSAGATDAQASAAVVIPVGPDYGPEDFIGDYAEADTVSAGASPSGPSSPSSPSGGSLPQGPAHPKHGYCLPEGTRSVSSKISGIALPDLPDKVGIVSFSLSDGWIAVELDRQIPKLKILELNPVTGTESTIFSQKDVSDAEAHAISKDGEIFRIRMTWKVDKAEFNREYTLRDGEVSFFRCTLTEKLDASAYQYYTSAVRIVYFDEEGRVVSEVLTFESEKEAFYRILGYDAEGVLTYARQSWRSLEKYGYILDVVRDRTGAPTALMIRNGRYDLCFRCQPAGADLNSPRSVRATSRYIYEFDQQLTSRYPRLATGLPANEDISTFPGLATPTNLPTAEKPTETKSSDGNVKLWCLTYGSTLYVFAAEDPVIVMKGNRVIKNEGARDINGTRINIGKRLKDGSPQFDVLKIE